MALSARLARVPLRLLCRPAAVPSRKIHSTPVAFKKKKSTVVVEDLFDDEEEWGVVEDLIPSGPTSTATVTPTPIGASSSSAPSLPPTMLKRKNSHIHLTPGQRLHQFTTLVQFVRPRIGRHPAKKTPLVRRSAFPQLIQLATTPEHMHTITDLMATWKEGRLGTQGKARIGPEGQPKGAHPYDDPTSELFARRCAELGIPEHALMVYGAFATYALPLTLRAARRLLHALGVAGRPFADVTTAAALYASYRLPPAAEDLPSCALLLAAALRHLQATEGRQRRDVEALVEALVGALRERLESAEPMPASTDVRDKTVRGWLKGVLLDVNEFLRGKEESRAWLEVWMARSRFIPSVG
ncbi:hypothetical protein B0H10DRAFT_2426979 [Mycena sp. CBHHK59/15]|nr:hypothetical protein B0H10DRAFT_2426979 [Mycena sp. CBHHK59/15]